MKASLFVVTALAAVAYAIPAAAPAADAVEQPAHDKRQSYGCGTCNNGKKRCWSCNSGGCTYTTRKC